MTENPNQSEKLTAWQVKDAIESLEKGSYLVTTDIVHGKRNTDKVVRDNVTYEAGCCFRVNTVSDMFGLSVYDSALRLVDLQPSEYLKLKIIEPDEVRPDTGLSRIVKND
jgi:hypothetical protein